MAVVFDRPHAFCDIPLHYCPGCTHGIIHRLVAEVIDEMGIEGATTIAVNTDAQDLFYSQSAKKVLLGRQTSKGLGAGGDPSVGEECAEESEDEIRENNGADYTIDHISSLIHILLIITFY